MLTDEASVFRDAQTKRAIIAYHANPPNSFNLLCLVPSGGGRHSLRPCGGRLPTGIRFTLLDASNTQHKIRLSGIDAPENGQPYSTVSGDNLGKLVFGKHVAVDWNKLDRYGRIVGKVLVSGDDANLKQVEAGLAWHYKEYQYEQSPLDRQLYTLTELQARANQMGLRGGPTQLDRISGFLSELRGLSQLCWWRTKVDGIRGLPVKTTVRSLAVVEPDIPGQRGFGLGD